MTEQQPPTVSLPCVRCRKPVEIPRRDYEEDPTGMITCDACWPAIQAEIWRGVSTERPSYGEDVPY